jgi:hypothetical protein
VTLGLAGCRRAVRRIETLERLRTKLRELGFVPIVFNFDKPDTKDFTDTVRLLANLSLSLLIWEGVCQEA